MAHTTRRAGEVLAPMALCLACASNATAQIVAKVIKVAGDRQFAVNTKTPPQPYKVRALDAAGNPVNGVNFFIGMGIWPLRYRSAPARCHGRGRLERRRLR